MKAAVVLSTLISSALGAAGPWAQCGGQSWTGDTTCVDGYVCTESNIWYSQCIPGTAASSSTLKTTTTTRQTTATSASAPTATSGNGSGFRWLGVDESVAEFGQGNYPGVWGTHFTFPDETAMATLLNDGYNMFRIPFAMERLAVGSITATFDANYLKNLTKTVDFLTSKGAWAVLDPHNFGRYNGAIIADTSAFETFWKNLATAFKDNELVVFDTNNEYHDMDQTLVFNLNQAAIDAIRAAGATSQYIFVEGNGYSGAWVWATTNNNLKDLTDPQGKIIYEMHQYLDSDGSGTSSTCVSSTVGAGRVASATNWLRETGKLGILGEFAGGANSVCKTAVAGLLDHLEANSDVWLGALWWSAGPWWGDYIFNFEPPSGTAYTYYNSLLKEYLP